MRSRLAMGSLGTFFCALALLQILGAHWALLQATAWMGMLVHYSEQAGIQTGLVQTFDGAHPCHVCEAIKSGKKQEGKKAPLLQAELKQHFLAPWNGFHVYQAWVEMTYPGFVSHRPGVFFDPAVPPPRNV
ncbi:MAG: hypothetical protein JO069_03820 [Verrucomicrobia bacterium]|nr:hypothetical protein [Verrucomicrobiota bacterium]